MPERSGLIRDLWEGGEMRIPWWSAPLAVVALLVLSPTSVSAQDVRAGVEQLASQIVKGAPESKHLRIAVADFPDLQGATSDLGRYIASRLTTRLAQTSIFFVIERQRLGQVLAELKFSMSDLVDPAKAKQLGNMAGVEAIVVGTVSDLGNQVDLDARLIEIETNRMLLGATTTISRDQVVDDMLKRGRIEGATGSPSATPKSGPSPAPSLRPPALTEKMIGVRGVDVLRVVVTSISRQGGTLTILTRYDNVSEHEIRLGMNAGDLYVTDEHGEKWNLSETTVFRLNRSGWYGATPLAIPPKSSQSSRLSFVRNGKADGIDFTLSGKYIVRVGGDRPVVTYGERRSMQPVVVTVVFNHLRADP
jgi:TolB-like protein